MKIFNRVKMNKPKRSKFDLSHEVKLSFNPGDLIPVYFQEIVPGDKFRVQSEILIRLAPMLAPVMHRVNVFTHFFFVPWRLVYANWENHITGGEDGLQNPVFPTFSITDTNKALFTKGKLPDYFGIPVTPGTITSPITGINALPFRAYQSIYNEYYRDENLVSKVAFTKNDTVDANELTAITTLRKRAWEKDYFTSALADPQKGGEVGVDVSLDLEYMDEATMVPHGGTFPTSNTGVRHGDDVLEMQDDTGAYIPTGIENIDEVNSSGEILINDLRTAIKIQEWMELNMRAGSRYIEQILAHFGVISSDARLQRPEYLGGGKNPITISEVLSHAEGTNTDIGDMYGHGLGVGNTHGFKKYFEEHGIIIGILSVTPRSNYFQGFDRLFLKGADRYQYYWPKFANLGEQEVYKQELYYDYTNTSAGTFAYQSRYADYKWKRSTVHGDFRDTLDYWHMARRFGSVPSLNQSFIEIESNAWIDAFINETVTDHHLYGYIFHKVDALRPMPYFGTPRIG